jgi:Protein of unknown function (DUF3224)
MSRHIEATFEVASWDETPFDDSDETAKLTEALVTKKYSGTSQARRRRNG